VCTRASVRGAGVWSAVVMDATELRAGSNSLNVSSIRLAILESLYCVCLGTFGSLV